MDKEFLVNPTYATAMKRDYNAEVVTFDRSNDSPSLVNDWVKEITHGQIKEVIDDMDQDLILANVLYFKGKWGSQFDGASSKEFFIPQLKDGTPENTIEVKMMYQDGSFRMKEYPADAKGIKDAKVLQLPFGLGFTREYRTEERLSMYIALPNESGLDALNTLEESLLANLEELQSGWKTMDKEKFWVEMPKFKTETTLDGDLNMALRNAGAKSMYSDGLSRMASPAQVDGALKLTKIIQKAVIEVDEYGVEAAATTAGGCSVDGYEETKEFIARRPFAYMLFDEITGTVYFSGRVVNPGQDEME